MFAQIEMAGENERPEVQGGPRPPDDDHGQQTEGRQPGTRFGLYEPFPPFCVKTVFCSLHFFSKNSQVVYKQYKNGFGKKIIIK